MLAARSPVAGDQKLRPKSARKPLQPKNIQSNPAAELAKPPPKPKQECARAAPVPAAPPAARIEAIDASLAEELSAIRKRLERLRADRERTERALRERDSALDRHRKEIERRGENQKSLEIEVDRLYRLNQLHAQATLRFSPIRSLREKERAKVSESESKDLMKIEDREEEEEEEEEESVGESSPQPSNSSTENK